MATYTILDIIVKSVENKYTQITTLNNIITTFKLNDIDYKDQKVEIMTNVIKEASNGYNKEVAILATKMLLKLL